MNNNLKQVVDNPIDHSHKTKKDVLVKVHFRDIATGEVKPVCALVMCASLNNDEAEEIVSYLRKRFAINPFELAK